MNFAMIILGAGALLLIATTMGRKEPTDPGVEDEGGFLPRERIAPPIPFVPVPAPIVPDPRFLPTFEGVDPDYFGE